MKTYLDLEKFAQKNDLKPSRYLAGESIFSEGESVDGVYYLLNDAVRILKHDIKGHTVFLWFAKSKELFGLTSFFQGDGNYKCSAVVGENACDVIFIPKNKFNKLITESPTLRNRFFSLLCDRINFMEMRAENMLHQNTDARLKETLLFLASKELNHNANENPKDLRIDYSMKDLSEMLGVSSEYLRRRVGNLKRKKILDYGRTWLKICDLKKLNKM